MLATMSQQDASAADSTPNDVAVQAASEAGLRHVSDSAPGLQREPAGDGFVYRKADGTPVDDEATLQRIRALAIPPAWTDVWICPHPRGHLQASGTDGAGRRQYLYHPDWRLKRDR